MLKQMTALTTLMVPSIAFAQGREHITVVHGSAGVMTGLEEDPAKSVQYYAALGSVLMIGDKVLSAGGEEPEAVTAAINYFERNPLFNAGIGVTCMAEGTFELDAPIMEGKGLNAGAVAGLKHVKYPINATYAVKTRPPHVMLSGAGAEEFVREQGLGMVEDNMYFATSKMMEWTEKLEQESKKDGTIGCVVLGKQGNLTAGTNTGGMFRRCWGRTGDSSVIGAGTYADNNSCAVSCTGHGEYFTRHAVAFDVCTRYKYFKESVEKAADYITHTKLNTSAGSGGLITVDKLGNTAMPYNSGGMSRGFLYKEKGSPEIKKGCGIGKGIVIVGEK